MTPETWVLVTTLAAYGVVILVMVVTDRREARHRRRVPLARRTRDLLGK